MNLQDALERGDATDVKAALERGANVNAQLPEGYRLLDMATEMADASDDTEALDLLLDAGARVNATNAEGITPLFFALRHDHPDVVRALLRRGADVAHRHPRTGVTPLLLAAHAGSTNVVRLLLEHGADSNVRGLPAWTAELRDGWRHHVELVESMFEGAPDDFAAREIRVHRRLLELIPEERTLNAVLAAATAGHEQTVQALLDGGASLDDEDQGLLAVLRDVRA